MNSAQPYGGGGGGGISPNNGAMTSSYPGGGGYHGAVAGGHYQQQGEYGEYGEYGEGEEGQTPSMTIDEMRILHRTALAEAEAKRTELRLVLASRYRELVGSSDEVIHMRERAEELNDLVVALPGLVEKVARSAEAVEGATTTGGSAGSAVASSGGDGSRKLFSDGASSQSGNTSSPQDRQDSADGGSSLEAVRVEISRLPRDVHRRLDEGDVHGAAATLIELFDVVASRSDSFPLATALSSRGGVEEKTASGDDDNKNGNDDNGKDQHRTALLDAQMKMVFLHVQTLPARTVKLARRVLLRSAARTGGSGARGTAAALSALDLLDVDRRKGASSPVAPLNEPSSSAEAARAAKLVDLYYDSKARLLNDLLERLALPSMAAGAVDATSVTNAAGSVLSRIVSILQHDVILHPYQIFVLRRFPVEVDGKTASAKVSERVVQSVMSTLPRFDPDLLKSKASRFLAAHLPLIRTKVKTVLVLIAGTTASKLGQIRQTLYDKTDGAECMAALDDNGVCTWDEAVAGTVDVRVVSHGTTFAAAATATTGDAAEGIKDGPIANGGTKPGGAATTTRRFSLWGALFSNTFSSLVHSLLTSSFHSVHVRVVSTLRTSLARAPPFGRMLPHEARRNALRIASDLDASLRRVSDDAHELLVHAEERAESERRLRQSLYVQTCEIMGRLLNELRRMLAVGGGGGGRAGGGEEDATKALIVGRLCHLLKFRLKSLPTLLDPKSSPAVLAASGIGSGGPGGGGMRGSSHGMITLTELSGSFDLADDDDDGLISFEEAMEAMESAFSGTHFRGAEMVRDTLLLSSSHPSSTDAPRSGGGAVSADGRTSSVTTPRNVTLSELALLSARGLRHDASGPASALGTVQGSLDDIVAECFREWARAALAAPSKAFASALGERMGEAARASDLEWRRLGRLTGGRDDDDLLREIGKSRGEERPAGVGGAVAGEVSPHVVSYLLAVSGVLNRSVCPADSLPPVPSAEHAEALGISAKPDAGEEAAVPNMMVLIRGSLLGEALTSMSKSLKEEILPSSEDDEDSGAGGGDERLLEKCSPSSLVQLSVDVRFVRRCFFERNRHGFSTPGGRGGDENPPSSTVDDSRRIVNDLSERLSARANDALKDEGSPTTIDGVASESHSRAFASCDLFLSSLFGERDEGEDRSPSSFSAAVNGGAFAPSPQSSAFVLDPLPSSRRFVLLPIQAEKSLAELRLGGGKYGKKQEEKAGGGKDNASGNALGTGFGFLSSMLTKTR